MIMMMIHVPCSSTFRPPHLLPLLAHTHARTRARMKAHNSTTTSTNLVDLSIGAIADHFHQLEYPRWILRKGERGGERHTKHACKYIKRNEYLIDLPPHHPVLYSQSGWLDVSAGCARFGWPPMSADIKTKDTAQIKNNNNNNKGGAVSTTTNGSDDDHTDGFFFFFFSILNEMRSKRARAHARAHSPAGMPGLYPPDFWPVSRSPFFSHEKR